MQRNYALVPVCTRTPRARASSRARWAMATVALPARWIIVPAAPAATQVTFSVMEFVNTPYPTLQTTTWALRLTYKTWSYATYCNTGTAASRRTPSSSATTFASTSGSTRLGERGCCLRWRATSSNPAASICSWASRCRSAWPRTPHWSLRCLSTSTLSAEAIRKAGPCPSIRMATRTGKKPSWTFLWIASTGPWLWATGGRAFLRPFTSTWGAAYGPSPLRGTKRSTSSRWKLRMPLRTLDTWR